MGRREPLPPKRTPSARDVEIAITNRQKVMAVDRRWLAGIVKRTLVALEVPRAELSLLLVDDAAIAAIHEEWLAVPGPTDVITFDLSSPEGPFAGDIAVSAETARRMARHLGWQPRFELAYYVVHGLLHLAGEDDLDPVARRRMRLRERAVMAAIGLPKPPRRPTAARRRSR